MTLTVHAWHRRVVAGLGLALTDRAYRQLLGELKATRQRGYALCRGETQIGAASAAVPVTSATGRPITTITVSTPVSRLNLDKIFQAQRDPSAALAGVLQDEPCAQGRSSTLPIGKGLYRRTPWFRAGASASSHRRASAPRHPRSW
ncbi:IclR family transcriptional regulator domain-containing protein [Arthrobacter sp. Hiyo1]|uniref:IclR family transcriptional regulator domain-containing protein n=1 Tax=Arthrobacter sp. Hiyo1 TaxID=1588020 RepID=UPI0040402F1A